jgi:hypothetical protein
MANKMDFVDFVSDLPDEEGDEQEVDLASESQEPIPAGVYYRVSGSRVVLVNNKSCKTKQ